MVNSSAQHPVYDAILTARAAFPQLITYYAWIIVAETSPAFYAMRITGTPVAVGHCFHRYSVAVLWVCLIWDCVLIPSKARLSTLAHFFQDIV